MGTTAYPNPILRSMTTDRTDYIQRRNQVAQLDTKRLDAGDQFPKTVFQFTDGSTQTFPEGSSGSYCVLLVYRGVW